MIEFETSWEWCIFNDKTIFEMESFFCDLSWRNLCIWQIFFNIVIWCATEGNRKKEEEMNILIKFEENKMRIKLKLSEHQSLRASINDARCKKKHLKCLYLRWWNKFKDLDDCDSSLLARIAMRRGIFGGIFIKADITIALRIFLLARSEINFPKDYKWCIRQFSLCCVLICLMQAKKFP